MHLPRHTIESHAPVPLFEHASFCSPDAAAFRHRSRANDTPTSPELSQPAIFACATLDGFLVAQNDPLKLAAHRSWPRAQGGLSHAVPVLHTSLLFLVGGGRVPRFAPNKVILWDEAAEYTSSLPGQVHRQGDSDDDDDHFDSIPSRSASTIFSAGSEFDAYGRAPLDEDTRVAELNGTWNYPSPAPSVCSSIKSLPEHDDLLHGSVQSAGGESHTVSELSTQPERSLFESSFGIGRLQASHLSDSSDPASRASGQIKHDSPDLTASSHSHAIMSSSANLADPFGEEYAPTTFAEAKGTFSSDSYASGSHDIRQAVPLELGSSRTGPSVTSPRSESKTTSRPLRTTSNRNSDRQGGLGLIDSVSSMATTNTSATAKRPLRVLRGREVAELEFSEVVRGIYATTILKNPAGPKQPSGKGKARATPDTAATKKQNAEPRFSIVLVVLLTTKAIVFELAPPSVAQRWSGQPASMAWKISKQAVAQTFKNPKGLGSVAPLYERTAGDSTSHVSAVVALPGRQKGHVQLLHVRLDNVMHADSPHSTPGPVPPVGASSIIVAHEASLAALALSPDGRLLATASSKGTLIRIWTHNVGLSDSSSTRDRRPATRDSKASGPGRTGVGATLSRELRRGIDPAAILSIAFAPDASIVAAASDKGTIHIFLLAEAEAADSKEEAAEAPRSSTSSTSRASQLGRVAASYLPAGLGSLAGQIPQSVLPQYLKSEWSNAQFRIPLKTFGASSRHYSAQAPSDKADMYSTNSPRSTSVGTEKSTEGAWAQMRSRISDIRKGEANVDEKMFLCWIEEPSSSDNQSTSTHHRSSSDQAVNPPPFSSSIESCDGVDTESSYRYRLIALTTSGGWYKFAIYPSRSPSAKEDNSGSTVLDMYRQESSPTSSDRPKPLECRLLESRPMAALLDGWSA